MKNAQDNDVDIFKHIQALGNNKLYIGAFVLLAVLFATGMTLLTKPVYKSSIKMYIDYKPIGYNRATEALREFEKKFYSKKVFEDWKRKNSSSIVFEDFNRITTTNSFLNSKINTGAKFMLQKRSTKVATAQIEVSSNQLSLLNNYFNYANYINDALIPIFIKKADEELLRIKQRYKKEYNINIINLVLSVDRHISKLKQGYNMIKINQPTPPEMIQPKTMRIFVISIFIGLLLGIISALFRHPYRQKKTNE